MRKPTREDSYRQINMSASVTLVIVGEEVLSQHFSEFVKQNKRVTCHTSVMQSRRVMFYTTGQNTKKMV